MSTETITEKRENIIWIFGDQHRGQALSCSGSQNVCTPNIDRLAATGVQFNRALSGFPLCCPFRGSLLTSRYPHECVPGHEYQLPAGQPTIAHVFRDAGYETAYFGKWHLDGAHGAYETHIVDPERRGGFGSWVGYENNNSQWNCIVHEGEGKNAFQYRLPGYETDMLSDLFIDYLQGKNRNTKLPFFAVLSVQPPHDPHVAPADFMRRIKPSDVRLRSNVPEIKAIRERARRDLAGYYAQIENLDWNIGRILGALEEADLLFNTHILFFSDHGDLHGSHGHFRKTSPYEESVRIPFIISGERPNPYNREGRRSGQTEILLNHIDIAPTSLGLCGIQVPTWMRGTDFSSCRLAGRAASEVPDSVFLQSVIPTGHPDGIDRPWRGVVTDDGWKYVSFEDMPWMMFNLNNDPFEQANLVHYPKYGSECKRLNDRLGQWISDTNDRFRLPSF